MPSIGWVILALIWTRAWWGMRIHWVTIRNLLMLPLLMIGFGVAGVFQRSGVEVLGWCAAALVALPGGFVTAPCPTEVDPRGRLKLPESIMAPLRYFLIFLVRMELLISLQVHPENRDALMLATAICDGAVAGYYVGWCLGLIDHFRRALAAPAAAGYS